MDTKDILKEKLNVRTDSELGDALGVGKTAISGWKKQGIPKYISALLPHIGDHNSEFVLVPRYNISRSCAGKFSKNRSHYMCMFSSITDGIYLDPTTNKRLKSYRNKI